MKKPIAILGVLCILPLGACAHSNNFGQAVQQTIAAETANPNAPEPNPQATMNGQRAAIGQARYTTDNVKQPESIDTLVRGGGSNDNSNNNSGGSSTSSSGTAP